MAKDKTSVQEYILSRKNILNYFHCEGDFFIKPLMGLEWVIKEVDDFHFLSYWNEDDKKVDAVVVKKDGAPMIYKTKEYTMVVAIDCVKIGFVFQNRFHCCD